jgi:hypothetical protein
MESAGAVFLPTAGYRTGSDVFHSVSDGFYWSPTANGTENAYLLFFDSDEAGCDVYGSRYCGQSVRLVLVLQD